MSSLDNSSEDDRTIIEQQLGYFPRNFMRVSARTKQGSPIAIQTYPLLRSHHWDDPAGPTILDKKTWGAPFPTHFWLTDPAIARAIGDMERVGYIDWIKDYLMLDSNLPKRQQLFYCHEQCGVDRLASLRPHDRDFFLENAPSDKTVARMLYFIRESGVAGLEYKAKSTTNGKSLEEVSIKCLHTHYAHFVSTITKEERYQQENTSVLENPIGRVTHEILQTEFPHLEL